MKVLFVCGTWNENGGKLSKVCDTIYNKLKECFTTQIFNGGYLETLGVLADISIYYDIVIWFPNISNKVAAKYVEQIKRKNHKCLLVASKRNDGKYSLADLIHRALGIKANLFVEFKKEDRIFGRVIDPLGNMFIDWTEDIGKIGEAITKRLITISSFSRVGSVKVGEIVNIPDNQEFFTLVRRAADEFHKLIEKPANPSRFLGNASFRCMYGFPSFRKDGLIYVSRRNVDKCNISRDSFIAVKEGISNKVEYFGDVKPSVDTPIQVRLYSYYKYINYIIHGHVYLKHFPYTKIAIPCGAIDEFDEIVNHFPNPDYTFFGVNLKGHGFVLLSQKLPHIAGVIDGKGFMRRPMPEACYEG
jgi:hypothetical protein